MTACVCLIMKMDTMAIVKTLVKTFVETFVKTIMKTLVKQFGHECREKVLQQKVALLPVSPVVFQILYSLEVSPMNCPKCMDNLDLMSLVVIRNYVKKDKGGIRTTRTSGLKNNYTTRLMNN